MLINQATTALGFDLNAFAAALQVYADQYFCPVWGGAFHFVVGTQPAAGQWPMVFLDDADSPGALAYHDEQASGIPVMKVFVRTIAKDYAGQSPSVIAAQVQIAASHEFAETPPDVDCNRWANTASGQLFALEVADPVEETSFLVNGFAMSNFVFPAWFDTKGRPGARFDFLGMVKSPFSILKGGYAIVEKAGRVTQIFAKGDKDKERRFAKEDRRQHRSESRKIARVVHRVA